MLGLSLPLPGAETAGEPLSAEAMTITAATAQPIARRFRTDPRPRAAERVRPVASIPPPSQGGPRMRAPDWIRRPRPGETAWPGAARRRTVLLPGKIGQALPGGSRGRLQVLCSLG